MSTYGRLCTEFYDLSKSEAPPEALAFFLDCLEDASQPVLEPMCARATSEGVNLNCIGSAVVPDRSLPAGRACGPGGRSGRAR